MIKHIHRWLQQKARTEAIDYLKQSVNQCIAQKNYSEAQTHLEKILELNAQEAEALRALSYVLREQKQLDEGFKVLQQTQQDDEDYQTQLLAFVEAYQQQGEFEKMKDILYPYLQQHPEAVNLRIYLAEQLVQNAQLKEAQAELHSILKQDPDHLDANIGLGYCYVGMGDKEKALAQVQRIRQWDVPKADELLSAIYENIQNF